MSGKSDVTQVFLVTLANRLKQLDSLRREKDNSDSSCMEEFLLESIYSNLLHWDHWTDSVVSHLGTAEQKRLVEICIQLADTEGKSEQSSSLDSVWRREFLAMKILAFIAKQPFLEPHSRIILSLIFDLLVKKLQIPPVDTEPKALRQAMKVMSVSAYCLSLKNFHHILSPKASHDLINSLIVPTTVWCLDMETKDSESVSKVLGDVAFNYYALWDWIFKNLYDYTHPLLIYLASQLAEYSNSDESSGGYPKEFESSLKMALAAGKITDEHIVGLYVTRDHPPDLLVDILSKCDKAIHRVHVAYFAKVQVEDHNVEFRERVPLARMMMDDLITKNDDLFNDIALNVFREMEYRIGPDLWSEMIEGRKIRLMRKLLEINSDPEILDVFVRQFYYFSDLEASIEFDQLARVPISRAINKIHYMITIQERGGNQLYQYIRLLTNLLKLRRHRLGSDDELMLIELFGLLTDDKFESFRVYDYVIPFMFANSYQVYPSAWNKLIELLQYTMNYTPKLRWAPAITAFPYNVNKVLGYFLIADASNFYKEFGTQEVLWLLYEHCKRSVESLDFTHNLLKEVLLSWPREYEQTKLNCGEYKKMLSKLIELVITSLDSARASVSASELEPETNRFLEPISGLVIAFTRHRETLYYVLDNHLGHRKQNQESRDAWLKENIFDWTRLMLERGRNNYEESRWIGTPFDFDKLGNLVVVRDGLNLIDEHFHECSELRGALYEPLLEVLKEKLKHKLECGPLESIETRIYQSVMDSLPAE